MIDFTVYESSGRSYGGDAGAKKGILYNGENWFLKFPKKTAGFRNMEISYTTAPLSEYLGSQIYALIGIDVHQTLLGRYNDKLVVACKDFRKPGEDLIDFRSIKNEYNEKLEEGDLLQSSGSDTHFSSIISIMLENAIFRAFPKLKQRFWDMFIIDALIGNNDRNNGNWGIIRNEFSKKVSIAPVFDNGASFSGKLSNNQISRILADDNKFVQSIYESRTCCYLDDDNRQINPLKFLQTTENRDCLKAIKRILPRINAQRICDFILSLPETEDGIVVISPEQKRFYSKTIDYRYNEILLPIKTRVKELITEEPAREIE